LFGFRKRKLPENFKSDLLRAYPSGDLQAALLSKEKLDPGSRLDTWPANQSRQERHPFVDASPQTRSTPSLPHNEKDMAAENIGAGLRARPWRGSGSSSRTLARYVWR
jgi:hypothetical protein